jgi:hypothetical protein
VKHLISSCLVTSSYVAQGVVDIKQELNWIRLFGNAVSKSFSVTMFIKGLAFLLFRKRLFLISFYCKHKHRTKNMKLI